MGMATKNQFQIVVPRRSQTCSQCGEKFAGGMSYYSSVAESEEEEVVRSDTCEGCWKGSTGVYWKGRVPVKEEKAKYADLDRDDRALAILKDCLREEGEAAKEEAFVLSLYLARQRRLLSRKALNDQQLYEVQGTEEILAIPILPLSSLQVEQVQGRIAEKLQG